MLHSNYVNYQVALRAVLKPETYHQLSSQATQISVLFVRVYAWSTFPFIAVSNRFSRCLRAASISCFCSFRLLFDYISIDYKTLRLNYFVFKNFYLLPSLPLNLASVSPSRAFWFITITFISHNNLRSDRIINHRILKIDWSIFVRRSTCSINLFFFTHTWIINVFGPWNDLREVVYISDI